MHNQLYRNKCQFIKDFKLSLQLKILQSKKIYDTQFFIHNRKQIIQD